MVWDIGDHELYPGPGQPIGALKIENMDNVNEIWVKGVEQIQDIK